MKRRALPARFVGGILYPLWKSLLKDPTPSLQRQLEERETLDSSARGRVRRESLARILRSASHGVSAWNSLLPEPDEICSENAASILEALDPTSKDLYRDWGARAFSGGDASWEASSTGGSTGEPFYFRCDRSAAPLRRANAARCLGWMGIQVGDPNAVLWGFALGAGRAAEFRNGLRNVLSNQLTLSSFAMDSRVLDHHLDRLAAFCPRLFVGYPSALTVLADHAAELGRDIPGLEVVISSGEALFDGQREAIERGLGARVYNRYGSREFAAVAQECSRREGLHVLDDGLWVEILDESGAATAPGEIGELVVTDLHNHAMPFLRYRTGDLAEWAAGPCSCGRNLPLLRRVEGRAFDIIRTPSGKQIGGYFWTWLSRAVPGIAAFQVYQDRLDRIELRVVTGDGWTREAAGVLEDHVAKSCGGDIGITVLLLQDIPRSPSGKHRFIVSQLESDS